MNSELRSRGQKLYLEGREIINMFTAGAAVLGCSAEGSDCGSNLMVRAFSIALMHSCGAHTVRWTVALRRPKRSVDHAVNI